MKFRLAWPPWIKAKQGLLAGHLEVVSVQDPADSEATPLSNAPNGHLLDSIPSPLVKSLDHSRQASGDVSRKGSGWPLPSKLSAEKLKEHNYSYAIQASAGSGRTASHVVRALATESVPCVVCETCAACDLSMLLTESCRAGCPPQGHQLLSPSEPSPSALPHSSMALLLRAYAMPLPPHCK